jgi:hypothetical protein
MQTKEMASVPNHKLSTKKKSVFRKDPVGNSIGHDLLSSCLLKSEPCNRWGTNREVKNYIFGRTYCSFKYKTKIYRKYKLRDDGWNKWTILSDINCPGGEELLVMGELAKKIPNFVGTKRLITLIPVLKYLKWISTLRSILILFSSPHGTTRLPLDGFSWNLVFESFFRNTVEKIQVSLKSGKNKGYFTCRR